MCLFGNNCNGGDNWLWVLIIIILIVCSCDNGIFGGNGCCNNGCDNGCC